MKLLFAGDVMPGGVLPYQDRYIDGDLANYLKGFDFRICTLECGVGTGLPFDKKKMETIKSIVYVRDEDLCRVVEMGFNAVSLANNHAMDLGIEGLQNAISVLDKLGIRYFGAGMNLEEARRPVVLKERDRSVAVLGCMVDYDVPTVFYAAKEDAPGVYQASVGDICTYIKELKKTYDRVIVMPHWGEEHKYLQRDIFKSYARRMLAAGADCIIGSHPHIINPVVKWGGKKCFFSLGNFLFPEKCMQVPRPMFYPETVEECRSLKRVWTYPKSIEEPVVAVWKPRNRLGMMVEMDIREGVRSRYRLTRFTADNVLHHHSSLLIRFRMAFWALLLHMPHYGIVQRFYNHRYNLLSGLMDRLQTRRVPVRL